MSSWDAISNYMGERQDNRDMGQNDHVRIGPQGFVYTDRQPLTLSEDQPDEFGSPGIITGGGGLDEQIDTRPSLTRGPEPTWRDTARMETLNFLQEQFGWDTRKARDFAETLWGTSGDLSKTAFGIGVADLLPPISAPLTMQEGIQTFGEGMETGSGTDMALGAVLTAAGALESIPVIGAGFKMLNKAAQSEVVKEFITVAGDAFNRTGEITQDALIEAGEAAQARLDSMMQGATLSANPVGAAGDALVAGAGKVARAMKPKSINDDYTFDDLAADVNNALPSNMLLSRSSMSASTYVELPSIKGLEIRFSDHADKHQGGGRIQLPVDNLERLSEKFGPNGIAEMLQGLDKHLHNKFSETFNRKIYDYADDKMSLDEAFQEHGHELLEDFNGAITKETQKYIDNFAPASAMPTEPAPVFYSAVANAVDALPMDKGNAAQMRAMIAKSAEVKPEEMAWIGLDDFLKGKKSVTKQEIKDFVDANQVRIEEVTKRGESSIAEGEYVFLEEDISVHRRTGDPSRDAYLEKHNLNSIHYLEPRESIDGEITDFDYLRIQIGEYVEGKYPEEGRPFKIRNGLGEEIGTAADLEDAKHQARLYLEEQGVNTGGGSGPNQGLTKFSNYTLPGGENYREVLLRLPDTQGRGISDAELKRLDELTDKRVAEGLRGLTDAERDEYLSLVRKREDKGQFQFRDGHYDESNVLAHMRLNDRTGPNGEKILFVEEIQSDWHQRGRKQGYKSAKGLTAKRAEDPNFYLVSRDGEFIDSVNATSEAEAINVVSQGGVPDAPLKKTWHEMSFRRIARMAAEEGYDAIAWTPGKLQAERYDLSKQVSELRAQKHDDGTVSFGYIPPEGGNRRMLRTFVPDNEIEGLVGKEMAEKIRGQNQEIVDYSGVDLEVGGEGMKGFYDKMLKGYADKWGKKFGAKVGVTEIESKGAKGGVYFEAQGVAIKDPRNDIQYGDRLPPDTDLVEYWGNFGVKPEVVKSALESMEKDKGSKVWTLPVTKKMRDSVLGKGVATFGAAGVAAGLNDREARPNGN